MKVVRPGPWDPDDDGDTAEQEALERRARKARRPRVHVDHTLLPDSWSADGICSTGKRRYPSETAARAAARSIKGGGRLSTYLCRGCDGWHKGHLPSSVLQGRLTRDDIAPPPR